MFQTLSMPYLYQGYNCTCFPGYTGDNCQHTTSLKTTTPATTSLKTTTQSTTSGKTSTHPTTSKTTIKPHTTEKTTSTRSIQPTTTEKTSTHPTTSVKTTTKSTTSTLNGLTVTAVQHSLRTPTQDRPKSVGNKWLSIGFSTLNTFQGNEINLFS
jgi:hypothetical protein